MTALFADLLPWVLAFYLADGLAQLGRGHLLLAGSGRLRPLRAGLRWLGISPLAEAVALFDLPFLRAGDRLYLLDPRRRDEPAVIEEVDLGAVEPAGLGPLAREGKAVTAGGRRLLTAPTPEAAEELRALLAGGGAASADLDAARALRRRLRPYRIALRGLAVMLAALLLAAAAAGGWLLLPVGALAAACGATLLATGVAGGAYLRAGGEGWSRSVAGALGMLLPWAAMHPLVHLSRPLFRRFDAMTAAAALLEPVAFRELAARELVRARLSRRATPGELSGAWDERERHLARLLEATGSSPEEALVPPPAADGAAAYCPLCRTRYRPGFTVCADCGAPLEPLPADSLLTAGARTPPTAP